MIRAWTKENEKQEGPHRQLYTHNLQQFVRVSDCDRKLGSFSRVSTPPLMNKVASALLASLLSIARPGHHSPRGCAVHAMSQTTHEKKVASNMFRLQIIAIVVKWLLFKEMHTF